MKYCLIVTDLPIWRQELSAVVVNSGADAFGDFEWTTVEYIRQIMEINCLQVTRYGCLLSTLFAKFFQLLRKTVRYKRNQAICMFSTIFEWVN